MTYHQTPNKSSTTSHHLMFLFSSCSCLWPIHWNQVLSREWGCSWGSADRRCCFGYISVINNFIAYYCYFRYWIFAGTFKNYSNTYMPWISISLTSIAVWDRQLPRNFGQIQDIHQPISHWSEILTFISHLRRFAIPTWLLRSRWINPENISREINSSEDTWAS